MNERNADFAAEANQAPASRKRGQAASERSSESNFVDVFLAELGRLKRIVAGMGLSASDSEDVLQDV
ncbi:hypothetical protein ES703_76830 [subsurface metagenome]